MNPTTADFQRYARIIIYSLNGMLAQHGVSVNGSYTEIGISIVAFALTLAWSAYGMRIKAKIAEMKAMADDPNTPVAAVIMTNTKQGREIANSIPGPVVTAGTIEAKQLAA